MANVLIDERDVRFVLFDLLKVQELSQTDKYAAFSEDVLGLILSEAQKFAETIIFPLNIKGDKEGAEYKDGMVYSTPGTKEAYQSFVEGGWLIPCESEDLGGQGMPHVVMTATHEMFFAANFPFMCYVNLTHDAAKLIEIFGTEEQKRLYMDRMYGGEWTGTMALTEPGAGSELGAIQVKATRRDDGTYSMSGSKIFITNGEHDVAENIIHMVLARIDGDPPGTKGLSVFIVPKYRVNPDGSLGERNDVVCSRIEEKIGLHASPTTSLTFGDNNNCTGYLLGGEREGIKIMFHMMNASRLEVGAAGQGTASVSYQHSIRYARERVQGQSIDNPDPTKRVPIIQHPDIRRMLLTMKAYVEGMRALLYYCSYAMDIVSVAKDQDEQAKWSRIIDLLIPIVKAYLTEKGVDTASQAVQLYGGYGCCSEYPVEQFMRDSKVCCIFEGTTGIQGMDLALRKLNMGKGKVYGDFLNGMEDVVLKLSSTEGWGEYLKQFNAARSALAEVPSVFASQAAKGNRSFPYLKATPFLEAFGDVIIAWFLLQGSNVAQEKLNELFEKKGAGDPEAQRKLIDDNADAAFYSGKIQSAKHFVSAVLPVTVGKLEAIKWNDISPWEIREQSFGG
jgi:alkylation response protein AidB-like acyl-CoA dehydrogenase